MKARGPVLLFLTALIWGCAFSAQSAAAEHIGPWTFTCIRNLIAAAALFFLCPLLDRMRGISTEKAKWPVKGGILCGIMLGSASMFQQAGIQYTTAGKAGFLTALYIVIVPLISIFTGKKPGKRMIAAVALAFAGLYFLSFRGDFSFFFGDLLLVICAFLFAVNILVIDRYGAEDGVRLSCIQFLTAGIICLIPMIVMERPAAADLRTAWFPIFYAGLISSCAGYTLQILGQKDCDPSAAGLILSFESVFAALSGFLFLHERLSEAEILGCILMMAAVLTAQIKRSQEEIS